MNRTYRLLLVLLVALGAVATCTPDESGQDAQGDTRLTSRGAGDLLSNGYSPSDGFSTTNPGSPSLQELRRPAPLGSVPERITVDSLGVDFGSPEAPLRLVEYEKPRTVLALAVTVKPASVAAPPEALKTVTPSTLN